MFWFDLPVFQDDLVTGTGASTLTGVTSAGAGTFSQTPYAHYDASTLGLANGADVATWPDLSGNGLDLAESAPNQPTYATNSLNGLGGVVFTGGQRIRRAAITTPAPRTIIFVAQNPPNDGTVKYMYTATATLTAKWSNADRWIFGNSDTNFLEFTETGIVTIPGIWTFAHQATGAFVRWNQVQKVSGNLSTPVADTEIVLGNSGNTGTGTIFYEIFVFDGVLSAGEIDTVEDYLFTKWFTAAEITGTGSSTLDGVTSAGSGTYTPGAITGTGTSTLGGASSAGSGTFTGAITGTGASILAGVTSVGTGTYTPGAITGTGATTLDGVTSSGAGNFILAITGTGTSTLDGVTSTGSGIVTSNAEVENVICGIETAGAVCGVEAPLASCRIGT